MNVLVTGATGYIGTTVRISGLWVRHNRCYQTQLRPKGR